MKRSIQIERLYTLGDYKNIKFIESISDIDEERALNPNFMNKLYKSLMIACDLNYLKYRKALEVQEKGNYTKEQLMDILSDTYSKLQDDLATIEENLEENEEKEND